MQTLESGVGDVDVRSIRQTIGSTASVGFHPTRWILTFSVTQTHAQRNTRPSLEPSRDDAACRPRRGRATRRDDPGAAGGGGAKRERARARAALLKSDF